MRLLITLLFLAMAPPMTIVWKERRPMPRAEAGGAAGFLGGELVIAGGTAWDGDTKVWLNDVQIYQLSQNVWRSGPALPVALAYGPFVQSADGLEIFGGASGRQVYRESWKLDPSKTKWRPTGALPAETLLGRAARLGDAVYLFGGCPDVADLTECTDAVWHREGSGPWRRVSSLPGAPLAMPAVAVARNRIYLYGGCFMPSPGTVVNRAEVYSYDPRSNAWATLRALPQANRGSSAVAVDDRSIYIFGGYIAAGFSAEVVVYDIESDTYKTATPMPFPLLGIEFIMNGRVWYGAGGEDRMRSRSARLLEGQVAR
jgi:N-acetylneuraminic acid mutarotase